jgi:chemotaxis protein methyltransferase CheR
MNGEEIAVLAEIVRRRSGIIVDPDKAYLIESRLGPVARREGFAGIHELIHAISTTREETLIWAVVEAMVNPETLFFRDRIPFDQFRTDVLPVLAERGQPARICSLGCSTGQEPYSLAMLLDEERERFPGLQVDILGCDLSSTRLEKAQSGLYTQFEAQRGLPSRLLIRHFDRQDEAWRLSPRIRQMVRWRRANLIGDLRSLGQFDVVFCRNVLAGMDDAARRRVLEQLALLLPEHGYLLLGLNETVLGLSEAFRPVHGRRGLYVRQTGQRAAA